MHTVFTYINFGNMNMIIVHWSSIKSIRYSKNDIRMYVHIYILYRFTCYLSNLIFASKIVFQIIHPSIIILQHKINQVLHVYHYKFYCYKTSQIFHGQRLIDKNT